MDTTITTEFFAPGKLFVLGEWSVLDGAPAVLIPAPAGQRGRASRQGGEGAFAYTSPGFEDGGAIDVVGATEAACRREFGPPPRGLALHVVSEGLHHDGHKLGFGSSGSVAALVAHAWAWACGIDDRARTLRAALDGHWDAQGGRGSGADVALSARLTWRPVCGSVVYSRLGSSDVRCEDAGMPVAVTAVWTGRSADTRALIDAVRACAAAPEILRRLAAVSRTGAQHWSAGHAPGVLAAAVNAGALLDELGRAAGVDIVTDEHRRIADAAGRGVVCKPSGAGGGDMALLLGADLEAMRAAEARLVEAGYLIFARLAQ